MKIVVLHKVILILDGAIFKSVGSTLTNKLNKIHKWYTNKPNMFVIISRYVHLEMRY